MSPPEIRRYLRHGTLPQLRAFEATARLGSLTRAAEELHIAQATVSVQIKKLTETIGVPLFEVVANRLQLTEAGQRAYSSCQEMFRVLAAMEQTLGALRSQASGALSLAVPPSARHFASRLLDRFAERHPGVGPTLQIHDRQALIERLGADRDDLYLFVEPPLGREVVAQAVVPNPLVVLASAAHPLAQESDIPFARFATEPLIVREPGSGVRMITLRLFAQHGLAPKFHMELGSDEAIREAILAGLGVGILPRYTLGLDPLLCRLVCLDVVGFPLESHWHFVYPVGRRLSAAARAFMDFARVEAKGLFRECLRGLQCSDSTSSRAGNTLGVAQAISPDSR
jgi:DNA-binding transcriptional LysR family regulator